ncbi:MAG: hypothetical protein ACHQ2Z_10725 [Elusimicrobiota bacterium]
MGTRAHQSNLIVLSLAMALACAGFARAAEPLSSSTSAPVSLSTAAPVSVSTEVPVSVSTAAPVSVSTQSASTSSFPLPVLPPSPATPTKEQAEQRLAADAVQALRDLAAYYNQKRRTPFMKLVSDDFNGDLGTLEDALSSDFRSYRTIDLQIRPDNSVAHNLRAKVQFTYDLTIANDQGINTKYSGHATYIFQQEGKKILLYQMSNNPIFGTSLSSIENPVAQSQGTPTKSQPPGVAAVPSATPPCSATTLHGSGNLSAGFFGYRFSTQSTAAEGQSDLYATGTNLNVNPGGGITDVGPCNLAAFTTPPATISGSFASPVPGDCYAIKTLNGNYAAIRLTNFIVGDPSTATFTYEYQPSGARCF